jgi:hypothetical protein
MDTVTQSESDVKMTATLGAQPRATPSVGEARKEGMRTRTILHNMHATSHPSKNKKTTMTSLRKHLFGAFKPERAGIRAWTHQPWVSIYRRNLRCSSRSKGSLVHLVHQHALWYYMCLDPSSLWNHHLFGVCRPKRTPAPVYYTNMPFDICAWTHQPALRKYLVVVMKASGLLLTCKQTTQSICASWPIINLLGNQHLP